MADISRLAMLVETGENTDAVAEADQLISQGIP